MEQRAESFLIDVLGEDGARAFKKAISKEESLASVVVPRAILSWLNIAARGSYEGEIPGQSNTYLRFRKSEGPGFNGAITYGEEVYNFANANAFHVAGAMAVAIGVDSSKVSDQVRDKTIQHLGKSIDTLVKANVLIKNFTTRPGTFGTHIVNPVGSLPTPRARPIGPGEPTVTHSAFAPTHVGQPPTAKMNAPAGVPRADPSAQTANQRPIAPIAAPAAPKPPPPVPTGALPVLKNDVPGAAGGSSDMAMWTKTEMPGAANKPAKQQEAGAPIAPAFQTQQPKPVKKPQLKISKTESEVGCSMCGQGQFRDGIFRGCLCFRDMAQGVSCRKSEAGYTLEFQTSDWDGDAIMALALTLKSNR